MTTLPARILSGLVAAALLPLTPLRAQSRVTALTRVTGLERAVVFEWHRSHPWDTALQQRTPVLVAEYRTRDGRIVTDCLRPPNEIARLGCGIAGLSTGERALRYELPGTLTAGMPAGPVCLLLVHTGNRPVPVRIASREMVEPSRFAHPQWEAALRLRTDSVAMANRLRRLEDSLARLDRRLADEQVNPDATCASTPNVTFAEVGGAARPVAEPAEHPRIARLVCTMQLWIADSVARARGRATLREGRLLEPRVPAPSVLGELVAMLPEAARRTFERLRGAQWRALREDWTRFAADVAGYRQARRAAGEDAHFGSLDATLRQQSVPVTVGAAITAQVARRETPDPTLLTGYVGASLEAYSTCVEDGASQLAALHEDRALRRSREGAAEAAAAGQALRQCESARSTVRTWQAARQALAVEVQSARTALEELRAIRRPAATREALNAADCRP